MGEYFKLINIQINFMERHLLSQLTFRLIFVWTKLIPFESINIQTNLMERHFKSINIQTNPHLNQQIDYRRNIWFQTVESQQWEGTFKQILLIRLHLQTIGENTFKQIRSKQLNLNYKKTSLNKFTFKQILLIRPPTYGGSSDPKQIVQPWEDFKPILLILPGPKYMNPNNERAHLPIHIHTNPHSSQINSYLREYL